MRYRKKPVEVSAFQMTRMRRWNNEYWPIWLHCAWNTEGEGSLYCVDGGEQLFIGTLEGPLVVQWDDWIIMGVQGEIYPCKPDIFEMSYDAEDSDDMDGTVDLVMAEVKDDGTFEISKALQSDEIDGLIAALEALR